jgi:hypothetical protein
MSAVLNLSPHARADHWSAFYIGMAWREDFNCWHLVRAVQWSVFKQHLPPLAIGTSGDERNAALGPLLRGGAWQAIVGLPAQDGDVLSMWHAKGTHVGVVAVVHGKPHLLHNLEGADVRIDPIDALGTLGYGHFTLWRAA